MIAVAILLLAAAAALGLRSLGGLLRVLPHPADRLVLALGGGVVWVAVVLRVSASFGVVEAGLGLLISLAPVGAFDLTKWWYRARPQWSPWLWGASAPLWLVGLRWVVVAGVIALVGAWTIGEPPPMAPK